MTFGDAIRLGSVATEQMFYGFFERIGGRVTRSCVLGAAMIGTGLQPEPMGGISLSKLMGTFPFLGSIHLSCPAKKCKEKNYDMFSILIHLNDDHHWTRPRIANWVDGVIEPLVVGTRRIEAANGVETPTSECPELEQPKVLCKA